MLQTKQSMLSRISLTNSCQQGQDQTRTLEVCFSFCKSKVWKKPYMGFKVCC